MMVRVNFKALNRSNDKLRLISIIFYLACELWKNGTFGNGFLSGNSWFGLDWGYQSTIYTIRGDFKDSIPIPTNLIFLLVLYYLEVWWSFPNHSSSQINIKYIETLKTRSTENTSPMKSGSKWTVLKVIGPWTDRCLEWTVRPKGVSLEPKWKVFWAKLNGHRG